MKARSFDIFEVNKYLQDWGIEVYGELAPKRKLSQHRLAMIMLNGGVGLRGLVTSYCSHFLVFSTGTGSTRGKSWGVLLAFYTANKASQVTLKKILCSSYVNTWVVICELDSLQSSKITIRYWEVLSSPVDSINITLESAVNWSHHFEMQNIVVSNTICENPKQFLDAEYSCIKYNLGKSTVFKKFSNLSICFHSETSLVTVCGTWMCALSYALFSCVCVVIMTHHLMESWMICVI